MNHPQIKALEVALAPYRQRLLNHPVYQQLNQLDDVRILMQEHVFAVWDFMSLLKHLQMGLTCAKTPWIPSGAPSTRRLINEIVFEEESDVDWNGKAASHFEMYLAAMHHVGANAQNIESLLDEINAGQGVSEAIEENPCQDSTKAFVRNTFGIIAEDKLHLSAAAFTFGREDLIPGMFRAIVKDLSQKHQGQLDPFVYYLERHIELDEEHHTPLAIQMLVELCEEDEQKWEEAIAVCKTCMEARIQLWDGISSRIEQEQMSLA